MLKSKCKCVKCGENYIQERGGGAKPINTSHLCDSCGKPPQPAKPVKEPVNKKG